MTWTIADIPDLSGRRALVTGATDGLGVETALALAAHGARVVLTGRNSAKGDKALARIRQAVPAADVAFDAADLSDLAQVRAMAARVGAEPLDILVNNAGLMGLPKRRETADGFEMQLGVNYLAHFVLTGVLLDALRAGRMKRVVSLSSLAHVGGRLHFGDLQSERRYSPFAAYGQSKLAMLMFALELQRRSDGHGWGLVSVAAHPGVSATNLIENMRAEDGRSSPGQRMAKVFTPLFSQDAARGALPQLLAATDPSVEGGSYWGPDGLLELKGAPKRAYIHRNATNPATSARLWEVSQALTGQPFGQGA
jgi:NAD(P)-dependent dehydrogenase (short-subunit alcohol dehydrogenase family)